ncbi:MAG: nucleotide sugar dehydrogenase [Bacilli bacterium]|nr:nucleotide sugar dehydrogenase [Bacilli bacterium]
MNLKSIRKKKHLTQADVCNLLNIPLRTYKRYEADSQKKNYKYFSLCKAVSSLEEKRNKEKIKSYKILVCGIGYVGLSLGVLLAKDHIVSLTDINMEKVELINQRISPFYDKEVNDLLNSNINLKACLSCEDIYTNQDMIIICVPTDYDKTTNSFNVDAIIDVLNIVNKVNRNALVIIKSTVPIGFTKEVNQRFEKLHIIFSPEFLREGNSVIDNLYPSRIIVSSSDDQRGKIFANILHNIALNNPPVLFMNSDEAEATKLFSNAYLAMRVAYFNELDTYAKEHDLSSKNIIEGMGKDQRIGEYYNNPSFGYGGYCLPKDSAQLRRSFVGIPNNNIIEAIVNSNKSRKEYIVNDIIKEAIKRTNKNIEQIVIGIYRLSMKTNSDNYRSSSSLDIYNLLIEKGCNVIVYEQSFPHAVSDLDYFLNQSDIIVANRYDSILDKYQDKIYTRDIYHNN